MSDPVDDFLAHYGVKGMKWGVTREDSSGGGPSRREVRTTAKYLNKGFDLEVAQKKARGRIAVENVLLVTGATVLAAGVGYAAFRKAEKVFGSVNLPMGTPVHHVNVHGPKLDIQDKPMFVSFNKRDQKFYDSVFAGFAKNRAKAENIYKSTLKTTTDIKAPSNFEAKRLYKQFAKQFDSKMPYSEFNYSFNGEGTGSPRLKKEFANFLQKKGYNAMIDNHDTVKSALYRTTKPTILFNPTRSVKKVNDVLLDNGKIDASTLKYDLFSLTKQASKQAAVSPSSLVLSLLVGLGGGGRIKAEKNREARVDNYKKLYPGTQLSDAEIYNLVTKG